MNISAPSSSTVANKGPSSHHEFFAKLYGSFEDKKVIESKFLENKFLDNNNDNNEEDICVDDDVSDSDNSSRQDNSFEEKLRNDISPRHEISPRQHLNLVPSQMEHPNSGKHQINTNYFCSFLKIIQFWTLIFDSCN